MINLKAFAQALKITWLRRIFQTESKWQFLIKKDVDTEKIVPCGSEYIDSFLIIIKNEFWKVTLKALLRFQLLLNIDWDSSTIYQTPIFYNKNLTVGGKYFFYKSWFDSGICYIRDILDDQGNFYEYNVFIQKRSIHTNFLQYHGVIESIKRFWRKQTGKY